MGNWRSPLGALGLFFLLAVPILLAGPTSAATLKMLEHRKGAAPGHAYWLDRKAFDPDRYTEEGLRHRARALRYRRLVLVSALIGLALLVLS